MMNQVVEGIPGHLAAIKGYHVGGKTGTTTGATLADGAVHDGNVASFIGFAPVDDPKMIMLVKLDFKEDRLGGQVSAPVFARPRPEHPRLPRRPAGRPAAGHDRPVSAARPTGAPAAGSDTTRRARRPAHA